MKKILFLWNLLILTTITTTLFSAATTDNNFIVINEGFTEQDKKAINLKLAGFNESFMNTFPFNEFITIKIYNANKKLIGFAFLQKTTNDFYFINSFLIFHEYAGKGAGTVLLDYIKENFSKVMANYRDPFSNFFSKKGFLKTEENCVVYEKTDEVKK